MPQLEPEISEKGAQSPPTLPQSKNTRISLTGPSRCVVNYDPDEDRLVREWRDGERPISSGAGSQDVRDGLCADPGPLEARSPPA